MSIGANRKKWGQRCKRPLANASYFQFSQILYNKKNGQIAQEVAVNISLFYQTANWKKSQNQLAIFVGLLEKSPTQTGNCLFSNQ